MSSEWSKEVFAKNLRWYMEKAEKNQKEMAEIVGVSAPTFNEWLKGKKYPRIDKIEKLAQYFGILKSDLIEDKKEEQNYKNNQQQNQNSNSSNNTTNNETKLLAKIVANCNDATLTDNNYIGEPTEVALLTYANTFDVKIDNRIDTIPFDSNRKMMSTLNGTTQYSKGAIDKVLPLCDYYICNNKKVKFIISLTPDKYLFWTHHGLWPPVSWRPFRSCPDRYISAHVLPRKWIPSFPFLLVSGLPERSLRRPERIRPWEGFL